MVLGTFPLSSAILKRQTNQNFQKAKGLHLTETFKLTEIHVRKFNGNQTHIVEPHKEPVLF